MKSHLTKTLTEEKNTELLKRIIKQNNTSIRSNEKRRTRVNSRKPRINGKDLIRFDLTTGEKTILIIFVILHTPTHI